MKENEKLKTEIFIDPPVQGTIGVALSGGGSRALAAGMGQLRALKFLTDNSGRNLLEKTDVLSTVSGGSWVGATFEFIKENVSDDDFLNRYVPDQSRLVLSGSKNDECNLSWLPDDNIGKRITKDFGPVSMALELICLYYNNVAPDMMWQTIVGTHILEHYGLYDSWENYKPVTGFTRDFDSLKQICKENPILKDKTFHCFADCYDAGKTKRPDLLCNFAMFVKVNGSEYDYLVPVQATPDYTGYMSRSVDSNVKDCNGRTVGGGGPSSFAFNSKLIKISENDADVIQSRQLSLMDIVGTSSAFFAEKLENLFKEWKDPVKFHKAVHSMGQERFHEVTARHHVKKENFFQSIWDKLEEGVDSFFEKTEDEIERFLIGDLEHSKEIQNILDDIKEIIPQYDCWPVKNGATAEKKPEPVRFADGGCLENTGINSLLYYPNVTRIVSFINAATPLKKSKYGIAGNPGSPRIEIDSQVPPLFGYMPYNEEFGYKLYKESNHATNENFRYNQVFESDKFAEFLQGIADAAGDDLSTNSAVVRMKLATVQNDWFGVTGNREVDIVFVYNNMADKWFSTLQKPVQEYIDSYNKSHPDNNFPHFSTFDTELKTEKVNLLSNLTAWTVAHDKKDLFLKFYGEK